jgi:hypothetical protein
MANCFLGQERTAVGGIHATRDHHNARGVLQNTKKMHSAIHNKRRGMLTSGVALLHDNACLDTDACTWAMLEHFNWQLFDHPSLQPWSRFKRVPPAYVPEELVWDHSASTIISWWKLSNSGLAHRQLTSLTQAYKHLFPNNTSTSIPAVTTLRSSLSMYIFFVYNNYFLTACFVNSSPKVTFRIAIVFYH